MMNIRFKQLQYIFILSLSFVLANFKIIAQETEYETSTNIPYYDQVNITDNYQKERCVLDVYYPKNKKDFPTVIWFHGGGLTFGNKSIPDRLKNQGVAIIAVNYRFYPKIKAPVYIEDAAASVAWAFKNIEKYGGDPSLIFLSGHSAGGYLASMVGMDKSYLAKHNIDANQIAGLIPFSGHTITHFTVRREKEIPGTQAIIDKFAPLYHVRKDAPPLLLITGDREMELLGRYEENAYMMRMMKEVGHKETRILEMAGYGHNMVEPAYPLLLNEVKRIVKIKNRPNILFIIADDASWAHYGTYGSDEVSTPNIDRLAQEGVVFENAFVSTSSCSPSRASILTGRNGFELEEGATLWGYLPSKFTTYTEVLGKDGYRVASSGKGWGPGLLVDRDINPAGVPYNMVSHDPYSETYGKPAMSSINYSANFESFLKTTDQNKPFCFWIGTFEPHRGYAEGLAKSKGKDCDKIQVPGFLPDSKEVRNDICEYLAEIEHIETQVGQAMEVLERQGQLENTLIVITSDNGMPFPRAKATLYDYGTRMPLIAWWGDKIPGGRKISDMISLTDLAPTFLEAAHANIPWGLSGRSILPLLKSEKSGQIDQTRTTVHMYKERHVLYPDSSGRTTPARAIRNKDYLFIWNLRPNATPLDVDGGPTKSFMEDQQDKYPDLYNLSFSNRSEYELYNVKNDPYQLKNLAYESKYETTRNQLKSDLLIYLTKRKDPRFTNAEDPFLYNPYFGHLFSKGIIKWSSDLQGQNLSHDERSAYLKKSFEVIGENEFYEEMIMRQKGKL